MKTVTASDLIRIYNLQPHPEGGFFRESYRAPDIIPQAALPPHFNGDRNYATAIYFLLPKGSKSSLHRLESDETWHFYLGDALTIVQISPDGQLESVCLGPDILNGEKLQHTVPAGYWFGAFPNPEGIFSFVGCTVAPGFNFADFTLANRQDLIHQFPHAQKEIELLSN